jgi:hypothetical protein
VWCCVEQYFGGRCFVVVGVDFDTQTSFFEYSGARIIKKMIISKMIIKMSQKKTDFFVICSQTTRNQSIFLAQG